MNIHQQLNNTVLKKFLPAMLSVAVITGIAPLPANASTTDAISVGVTAGAIGIGRFGGIKGAAIGGILGGSFELGYYICVSVTGAGDPPDLINFDKRANPPLLIPSFSSDPTVSPDLNSATFDFVQAMSVIVQNSKGYLQTLDRLGGAELVGTPIDVANQQIWLGEFRQQIRESSQVAADYLRIARQLLAVESPEADNFEISIDMIKTVRDQEGIGIFSPIEQQLINDWMISNFELSLVTNYISGVPDNVIEEVAPLTFGKSLELAEEGLQKHPVPEPSAVVGLCACLGFGSMLGRKQPKKR